MYLICQGGTYFPALGHGFAGYGLIDRIFSAPKPRQFDCCRDSGVCSPCQGSFHGHPVLAGILGHVHGLVGAVDQVVQRGGFLAHSGCADAQLDVQFPRISPDGCASDMVQQPLGDIGGCLHLGDREQGLKLLPAVAAEDVDLAQVLLQQMGCFIVGSMERRPMRGHRHPSLRSPISKHPQPH
jgi:hypothetical protein